MQLFLTDVRGRAAADRVAHRRGESGLLATDVIEELPVALAERQAALFGEPG